ncbi:hypothetical protein GCM10010261_22370 [Streptomyces pilosus]|uniref:Uncharacterized protein n=1 Tax=Streptomyces pilosus TaxID=28893 RepID=A0A918BV46_9ACTN|nr:hypothetical protein GCM10010280_46410 [Streptomyces pilosus]GGV46821.1 hypothetical protein GCM10010261_22370 [Streptomyces pilosus]
MAGEPVAQAVGAHRWGLLGRVGSAQGAARARGRLSLCTRAVAQRFSRAPLTGGKPLPDGPYGAWTPSPRWLIMTLS